MKLILLFTVVSLVLGLASAPAQSVTLNTTPLGAISYPLVHGTTTYLSLPLAAQPIYKGAVSAVTATTISVADSPAPWTTGSLATNAQPYFVKFLTGPQAGRIVLIKSNTTNALTLDTTDHTTQTTPLSSSPADSFDAQAGNTFQVFPGETLATLFGTGTVQDPLSSLTGGTSVATADTVTVLTTTTTASQSYFFDTSKGFWRLYPATANANNTVIYPHSALVLARRPANGDTTFSMAGQVSDVVDLVKVLSKSGVYTSIPYATGEKLSDLQLGTNWTKGTSVVNADTLSVWNGSTAPGHFDTYYQLASDSTWRKYPDSATDKSSFVVPAGSAVCLAKRSNVSGSASFVQPPLPYDLN